MMVSLAEASFLAADVDIIYKSKVEIQSDESMILNQLNQYLSKEKLAKGVHLWGSSR